MVFEVCALCKTYYCTIWQIILQAINLFAAVTIHTSFEVIAKNVTNDIQLFLSQPTV